MLVVALLLTNLASIFFLFRAKSSYRGLAGREAEESFKLLHPGIAEMDVEDFLDKQRYYQTNYLDLRSSVDQLFRTQTKGLYGFYFENLNSGTWIGINEKEMFMPGSLLKVPAIAATLKSVDEGELTLKTPVTILEEDIDPSFGPLAARGYGYNMTVIAMINYTAVYSDNTANNALRRILEYGSFADALLGMGIPYKSRKDIQSDTLFISPRDYSNIFRSLYFSNYLRRPYSPLILSLLANTEFSSGLPAGIPPNVTVSHKIGFLAGQGYHHDCGIVYVPNNPYIICVMTKDLSQRESDGITSRVSGIVYDYVKSS